MQLRSRVIVIETQSQTQTSKRTRTPSQKAIETQPQIQNKRTRTPSQKSIESKESKKALAAMDAQNLRQKLQQLQTQSPKPISKTNPKRIRTLSLKAIEAQENQTFMEALDAEEEEIQQQKLAHELSQTQNRYETRSKNTNKTPYSIAEFNQDFFNDASQAWRANKIQKPNATYQYRCSERLKNEKRCSKTLHSQ